MSLKSTTKMANDSYNANSPVYPANAHTRGQVVEVGSIPPAYESTTDLPSTTANSNDDDIQITTTSNIQSRRGTKFAMTTVLRCFLGLIAFALTITFRSLARKPLSAIVEARFNLVVALELGYSLANLIELGIVSNIFIPIIQFSRPFELH